MRDAIRLKHYSIRTEATYIDWIKRCILSYRKRHPQEMGVSEIEAFPQPLGVTPATPQPATGFVDVLQATRIFRDHWDTGCDLHLEDEVPPDQRARVRKTVERLMLCRDPSAGYARYVCPGCGFDPRVLFSYKTRFCPPSAPLIHAPVARSG